MCERAVTDVHKIDYLPSFSRVSRISRAQYFMFHLDAFFDASTLPSVVSHICYTALGDDKAVQYFVCSAVLCTRGMSECSVPKFAPATLHRIGK